MVDETDDRADRRPLPLRLLDRLMDRGSAGEGPHPARAWLARSVGRDPARFNQRARCRQCGQWESVTVLRRSRRAARYWCQRCGAVVRLSDLRGLRPVEAWRAEQAPPPPAPAPLLDPQLAEVMPAAMREWLARRSRKPVRLEQLDRARIYQLYRQWDAEPAAEAPALPAFSAVVGALHDYCYRDEVVLAQLTEADTDPVSRAAVAERIGHARRWLAQCGTALCWIHTEGEQVDRGEVKAAVEALRAGEVPGGGAAVGAIRAALFGTGRGPSLSKLERVYLRPRLVEGLEAYLDTGEPPWREEVLGTLSAPAAPEPE